MKNLVRNLQKLILVLIFFLTMMRFFVSLLIIMFGTNFLSSQTISSERTGTIMGYRVERGDTVYYSHIQELLIRAPRKFRNSAEERQFWRLVSHVKRVYPYAKMAGDKLYELNQHYLTLQSEQDRKAYSKKVEDELRAEFEGELKKLTITQGRILMRLVDRETGHTTYEIVKDFRGSVSAIFWQGVARVFGSNLKSNFDPSSGEDRVIEWIIREIDEGWL